MCKSAKEGGQRCWNHANKAYEKALADEQLAVNKIEKFEKSYNQINATIAGLDDSSNEVTPYGINKASINAQLENLEYSLERGDIDNDTYERESLRLNHIGTPEYRKELENSRSFCVATMAKEEENLIALQKETKHARREMNTTHTGLKNLENEIREEKDTAKRRALRVEHAAGTRLKKKRQETFERIQKNELASEKLKEKAQMKFEIAQTIDPTESLENKQAYEEVMIEGQKLKAEAFLKKNDGHMESQALIDAKTGKLIPAKIVNGKFGKTWLLLSGNDPDSKPTKFMTIPQGKTVESRAKTWNDRGIKVGLVSVPGQVRVKEEENGSKKVVIQRADKGFDDKAVIVSHDVYGELLKKK